jgi:hypothetical protein
MTEAADVAEAAKEVLDAATSAPKTEVPAQVTKAPVPEVPPAAAWVRTKHRDTGLPLYTLGDQTVTYADAKSPWVPSRSGAALGGFDKLADAKAAVQKAL